MSRKEFNPYQKLYTFLIMRADLEEGEIFPTFSFFVKRMDGDGILDYLAKYDFDADKYLDFYNEICKGCYELMIRINLDEENDDGS